MASPKDKVFAEKQFAKYAQYGEELLHIYRVTLFPPKAFDVKKNIEQCDTAKRKGVHRLIALSCYRLLVIKRGKLKQKKATKNVHLYDLHEITSDNQTGAVLHFHGKHLTKNIEVKSHQIAEIIHNLRTLHAAITINYSQASLLRVTVPEAILEEIGEAGDGGPDRGLVHLYRAQSAYFHKNVSREFVHHIEDQIAFDQRFLEAANGEHFLTSRKSNPRRQRPRALELHEVPGIERGSPLSFHLSAVAASLRHNAYFLELSLKNVSPLKNIVLFVANILRHNVTVTSVQMENLEASKYFLVLGDMLRDNKEHSIQHLNLSGSKIPNSGILALAIAFEKFTHSLRALELRGCQLSGKRAVVLFGAFERNYGMSLSIEILDLSNNRFDVEGSKALENWLWEAKDQCSIREFLISNSNLNMTAVSRSFRSMAHLQKLDVSGNKIDKGAAQLLWVAIEESSTLTDLNVSNCGLKVEEIQNILLVLFTNKSLQDVHVDISYNSPLTSKQVPDICGALRKGMNLHTLAMSGYKLKAESFVLVLKALARKPRLDTLVLDKAFRNQASADVSRALALVLKHTPALKALSISGGYDAVLPDFLEKLAKNTSLLELRIHENHLSNEGTYVLAEMLRKNTTLQLVLYDRNGVKVDGWRSLRLAMEVNRTLLHLPFPWDDLEKVQDKAKVTEARNVLGRIQELASTNTSPVERDFVFIEGRNTGLKVPYDTVTPLSVVPPHLQELERQKKAEAIDYTYWLVNDLFEANPGQEEGDEGPLDGLLWIDADGNVSDTMPSSSSASSSPAGASNPLYQAPARASSPASPLAQFSFPDKPLPSPNAGRNAPAPPLAPGAPPLPSREMPPMNGPGLAPPIPDREPEGSGMAFPSKPVPAPPRR